MARIRTIKPEFPQSESMGLVSREARLCFILLWTVADDAGRLRGNSRMLASLLFPYDEDARLLIDGWFDELERQNCLQRYEFDGHSYIQIVNWLDHQKIDRPSKSKFPVFESPRCNSSNPREDSSEDQGTDRKGSKDQGRETPSCTTAQTGRDLETAAPADAQPVRLEDFFECWNRNCGTLAKVRDFTEERRSKLKTRMAQGLTLERFEAAVKTCAVTPFLSGSKGWRADFCWLVDNDTNIAKVLEGKYDNGVGPAKRVPLAASEGIKAAGGEAQLSEDEARRVRLRIEQKKYAAWKSSRDRYGEAWAKRNPWRGPTDFDDLAATSLQ